MTGYRGRELARNAAIGGLALATGLRLQEFTYLLAYEVPALPPKPAGVPIPFPVPAGVTKGRKFRTTWISYEALAAVHHYLGLDRAAAADGSAWRPPPRWGEPLLVTAPDARGGRINGVRRPWDSLTPGERRRLVAPGGGSCLIAVRAAAARSRRGRRCSNGPQTGSAARPSRGSRMSTPTGCAIRLRFAPSNGWSAATTGRPPGSPPTPAPMPRWRSTCPRPTR